MQIPPHRPPQQTEDYSQVWCAYGVGASVCINRYSIFAWVQVHQQHKAQQNYGHAASSKCPLEYTCYKRYPCPHVSEAVLIVLPWEVLLLGKSVKGRFEGCLISVCPHALALPPQVGPRPSRAARQVKELKNCLAIHSRICTFNLWGKLNPDQSQWVLNALPWPQPKREEPVDLQAREKLPRMDLWMY